VFFAHPRFAAEHAGFPGLRHSGALDGEPGNRGSAYIVAPNEFVERRALRTPLDGLFLLCRRQRELR
jgi:hypothetical protein